jgi:16S rRNA (guanine527-N7)-methyltransferase
MGGNGVRCPPSSSRVAYTSPVHREAAAVLLKASEDWGLALSQATADQVGRFLVELLRWNRRVNLTGARTLHDLLGEHIPDSFALARLCRSVEEVVDVGAGGGLPGIPFALVRPDCRVTLVEPRAKRVAFLRAAVREVGAASATVVRARLEELGDSLWTLALSRATFAPDRWLRMARRVLRPEGRVVVFASGPVECDAVDAHLVEEVGYRSGSGATRWAGAFSFKRDGAYSR